MIEGADALWVESVQRVEKVVSIWLWLDED